MTDELLQEARRLQAKNALKQAIYKLKAGTTLNKDDRVVLLAYIDKMNKLVKEYQPGEKATSAAGTQDPV